MSTIERFLDQDKIAELELDAKRQSQKFLQKTESKITLDPSLVMQVVRVVDWSLFEKICPTLTPCLFQQQKILETF